MRRWDAHRISVLVLVSVSCCGCGGGGGQAPSPSPPPAAGGFNLAKGFNGNVRAIRPAGDGSGNTYVGGDFSVYTRSRCERIARIKSDGTADPAFATGTGFNGAVWALALAADGSGDVYVGGEFTSYDGTAAGRITRLNADGSIDAAFNVGTGFDGKVRALAPAVDGSGDVYAGGEFTFYGGTACNRIVRLNSDGSVDGTFNYGTGFNGWVLALLAVPDGSGDVYVGGDFGSYKGTASGRIARLNADGSLDAGFAAGTGFNGSVYAMAVASDVTGRLYVAGAFTSFNGTASRYFIRLKSDGSKDAAFNVGPGFDNYVYAVTPATDGSGDVYVGGWFTAYYDTWANSIIRLNADGSADPAFDTGTGFDDLVLGQSSTVYALATANDGSGDVHVGGAFIAYDGTGSNCFIRLNADGSIDPTANIGAGFGGTVYAIARAADGSGDVYAGGLFIRYNGLSINGMIRLNADGSADPAFNIGDGFAFGGGVLVLASVGDGSGRVYAGGTFTYYDGVSRNRMIRLKPDGWIDSSFGVGSGFSDSVKSIVPVPGGDVYVGGEFSVYNTVSSPRLIRLNVDGSRDPGFDVGTGFSFGVYSIAPAADGTGDIYVGGMFGSYKGASSNRIIRLHDDGSVDATFNVGTGFNDNVYAIAPATDGSGDVYVGGFFTSYQGTAVNRMVRLNADGSIDAAFNIGTGFNSIVDQIVPATDGSGGVYAAGYFTTYNGSAAGRLVRLDADGSADAGFVTGTGFNMTVLSMVAAADGTGDIFVGGGFSTYAYAIAGGILRVNPDGSIDP
ncbi:MAG: hypothetical protein HYY17_13610 [Planctomycetes bacterium]|nr:hypothetical protein [Planctomycetota bacterium]